jgi:hypothetical protein
VTARFNQSRRHFLSAAAMMMTAAQLGPMRSARAGPAREAFGALKQIDAGVLNIGYAELGPASGRAVVLLHGWPYDIHSFVDVTPLLASRGYSLASTRTEF